MLTRSFLSISIILTAVLIACSSAKPTTAPVRDRWDRLGEKQVDYRVDHDVLNVSRREGTFKQLKLVVRNGSLNMYRCTIHFENGGTQEVELRHTFTKNSGSRIIDLNGNQRFIDRISFWYDTKNFSNNNRAVLVVWAK